MKIKVPFKTETHKKPLVLGKGGSYRPETFIFRVIANGREVQRCFCEVREA